MEFLAVILLAGAAFGLCFLFDKGFTHFFRNRVQHQSGLAVRPSKRYAAMGIIVAALGVAALLAGIPDSLLLIGGGIVLMIVGFFLIGYYVTFGIFYDYDTFLLTTFGKKSVTYSYRDIRSQQLYNSYGNIIVELHLADGRAVQLQASMDGVYPFLDYAYSAWLRQTGRTEESCASFHDPANSCWFPPVED